MKTVLSLATALMVASVGASSAATVVNWGFDEAPAVNGQRGNTFEDMPTAAHGGHSWDIWSSLPGWTTTSGAGIEVQSNRTLGSIDAHSGQYYVELDSHNNSSMEQVLSLKKGTYNLSFWYSPRTNRMDSNGIAFRIGSMADSVMGPNGTYRRGEWTEVTRRFTIDKDGDYALGFAAIGRSDSYGGLIDSVGISAVPLPATALLLLGGLAGLGAMRRKSS